MKFSRLKITLVVVVILGLSAAYQVGVFRFSKVKPGEQAPQASLSNSHKTIKVEKKTIPVYENYVGTVRSRDEIELSSRIAARIVEIRKRSGDTVQKGELLIKLDDAESAAILRKSQERLNSASASLELARKEHERNKQLLEKLSIPKKVFEQSEAVLKSAEAEFLAAEQAIKEAEATLSYTEIKSPLDGIVSERLADPGDMAVPGKILLKVFDPARLMLYVPVRESLAGKVKIGEKIEFNVPSLSKSYVGDIREIVPSVDEHSRTFLIKICIGEAPELYPGMFGNFKLVVGSEEAILIPKNAIKKIGQLEYAVLRKDNGLRQALIRTVPYDDANNKVLSGLLEGDILIVE